MDYSGDIVTGNITSRGWACFSPYSSSVCARHTIISLLGVFTLSLAVYKLVFFHRRHHQLRYQFIIFYAAALETAMLVIHWMLVRTTGLLFAALSLQAVQSVTLVYFYSKMAARQIRKEKLLTRYLVPSLVIDVLYSIGTMIYAWTTLVADERECRNSAWIQFSIAQLLLSLLFVIAGVVVSRTVLTINMERKAQIEILRSFWGLATSLFISAVASFVVDTVSLAADKTDCRQIFGEEDDDRQVVYFIILRFLHYLLPIWAMAAVFAIPAQPKDVTQEPLVVGDYQSYQEQLDEPYPIQPDIPYQRMSQHTGYWQ